MIAEDSNISDGPECTRARSKVSRCSASLSPRAISPRSYNMDGVREFWSRVGATEPHFGVLTDPKYLRKSWSASAAKEFDVSWTSSSGVPLAGRLVCRTKSAEGR